MAAIITEKETLLATPLETPKWAVRAGETPLNFVAYTDESDKVHAVPPVIRGPLTKQYRGQTFKTDMTRWLKKGFTEKPIYSPPADLSVIPSQDWCCSFSCSCSLNVCALTNKCAL